MASIEELRGLFCYDPEEGVLRWRSYQPRPRVAKNKWGPVLNGGAGYFNAKGYIHIVLPSTETVLAHRVAWAIHYGNWPALAVDHKNGVKSDNRICNLRELTDRENNQNRHSAMVTNRLGVLGVKRSGKKFRADIEIDGKCHYLGTHPTVEIAHEAYLEAKRRLHPAFTG